MVRGGRVDGLRGGSRDRAKGLVGAGGGWGGGANTGSDQSAAHAFLKLRSKVPFQEKPPGL